MRCRFRTAMERLDRRPERGGVVRYRVPLTGTSGMPVVADGPNVMGRSALRIMPGMSGLDESVMNNLIVSRRACASAAQAMEPAWLWPS